MKLNLYTYKGSKKSLIAPWVTVGYLVKDETLNYESIVPDIKHIYYKRKSIKKFDNLLKGYINIKTNLAHDINYDGDYCIKKAEDLIIRSFRIHGKLTINKIRNPKVWDERLTVIISVFYRTEYLKRNSRKEYDLLELDSNLEKHLELLQSYKYLPPYYLWDKTMGMVENMENKPQWWYQEIKELRRETNYDATC